jgi:large subunit ribosomal protein L18Ae
MRTQNKIKKSHGEVLKIQEVFGQKKVEAKNFGIYLKYHTHVGDKNMFKEYRAESIQSALDQMYNEMGGNYRVSRDRVEVIKTVELSEDKLRIKKPRCLQYKNTETLSIPVWKKSSRPSLP